MLLPMVMVGNETTTSETKPRLNTLDQEAVGEGWSWWEVNINRGRSISHNLSKVVKTLERGAVGRFTRALKQLRKMEQTHMAFTTRAMALSFIINQGSPILKMAERRNGIVLLVVVVDRILA